MSDNWVHWLMGGIVVLVWILAVSGCLSSSGSGQDMCETGEYSPSGMAIMEPC